MSADPLPVGAYVAAALAAVNIPCDSGEDVDRFLNALEARGYAVVPLRVALDAEAVADAALTPADPKAPAWSFPCPFINCGKSHRHWGAMSDPLTPAEEDQAMTHECDEVLRLRQQNHEYAQRRDREQAALESTVARFKGRYERARELVKGSPVDWTDSTRAQNPDGWWSYTSEANRDILTGCIAEARQSALAEVTRRVEGLLDDEENVIPTYENDTHEGGPTLFVALDPVLAILRDLASRDTGATTGGEG